MTPRQALEAELKGLEESLLDPDIRKSTQLVELLADEFIEFGSSGRVYTRDDLVAVLQAESPVVQTTSRISVGDVGTGRCAPDLQDPQTFRPCRRYPSILVVAEIERQVANGLSSGNRDPGHVAMPGTGHKSRPAGAAPVSPTVLV